jgi:hypothetical protein
LVGGGDAGVSAGPPEQAPSRMLAITSRETRVILDLGFMIAFLSEIFGNKFPDRAQETWQDPGVLVFPHYILDKEVQQVKNRRFSFQFCYFGMEDFLHLIRKLLR